MAQAFQNLNVFNERRTNEIRDQITFALRKATKQKQKFATLKQLTRYVEQVSGVNRTTLARNNSYKTILTEYFEVTAGGSHVVTDEQATNSMSRPEAFVAFP